jgi:hypothetical protein
LANGDPIDVSHLGDLVIHQFQIPALLRSQSEKGKRGGRNIGETALCQHNKMEAKNET